MIEDLKARLKNTAFAFPAEGVPAHFRQSAVLLLLWPEGDSYRLVLTKRPEHLEDHAGEMCLPGGKLLPGESHEQAAVRETEEEIGVAPNDIEVLGRLSDSWSGLGYQVIGVVGWVNHKPQFRVSDEVGELITISLDEEMDVCQRYKRFHTVAFNDWEIRVNGQLIVGLTADLILELIDTLRQQPHYRGQVRFDLLGKAKQFWAEQKPE